MSFAQLALIYNRFKEIIPQQSSLKKESEYSQNKVKGINIAYLKSVWPYVIRLILATIHYKNEQRLFVYLNS